tara:strand:+ start:4622 stop:4852 length:231 start_codon:yes stop_codon:yes gene_type:complete
MSDKSLKLHNLQDIIIDDLINKIKSGEATASELSVARQLLKDNGIQAVATDDSPMKELVASLPFDDDSEHVKLNVK